MIEVEVKVVGMFGDEMLALSRKVQVKQGARPADAIVALFKSGAISKQVYKQIKSIRMPCYLVYNDEKVEGNPKKIKLEQGDSIGVMQLMAGG